MVIKLIRSRLTKVRLVHIPKPSVNTKKERIHEGGDLRKEINLVIDETVVTVCWVFESTGNIRPRNTQPSYPVLYREPLVTTCIRNHKSRNPVRHGRVPYPRTLCFRGKRTLFRCIHNPTYFTQPHGPKCRPRENGPRFPL